MHGYQNANGIKGKCLKTIALCGIGPGSVARLLRQPLTRIVIVVILLAGFGNTSTNDGHQARHQQRGNGNIHMEISFWKNFDIERYFSHLIKLKIAFTKA
jgi:hypothetical protein